MSKPTPAQSLAAYLKQNKFLTGVLVVGIVAIVAIAGVLAATNDNDDKQTNGKPAASQSEEAKKDDNQGKGGDKEVAVAPTATTTETGEVLGDSVTGAQSQIPSTLTAPVPVAATTAVSATDSTSAGTNTNTGTETPAPTPQTPETTPTTPSVPTDPATPANPGTTPTDPTTTPTTPTTNPTPTPATTFNRALVSLTFDDGWKSIHSNGRPLLQKYGLASTQYVNAESIVGATTGGWSGYMTASDLKDFATGGSEIAWHTNTHVYDLTTVDEATRNAELKPRDDFLALLMSVGVTMTDNYAAPFGTYSAEAAASAKANGFNSYRTTYDGYNTKGATDLMNIKVKNVCGVAGIEACNGVETTPTQVATWVAEAQASKAWLVIVFHEVGETSRAAATANGTTCDADLAEHPENQDICVQDPTYAITSANLDGVLNAIKQSNAPVVTVQQAIAELKTQL